jgi:acetyl esterase
VGAALDRLLGADDLDPGDVVLLGLSAGGNLAASTSATRRGSPNPIARQVLVYPMLDSALQTESACRHADLAPLSRYRAAWFWDQYVRPEDRTDPRAVPMCDPDPTGLPPTHLVVADLDVLRDEGLAYAERLNAAGVPATSRVWPGAVHGFLPMAGLAPDLCAAAEADIVSWIGQSGRPQSEAAE